MESKFNTIKSNLHLTQSKVYKDFYTEIQETRHIPTFNEVSITSINDWYNSIVTKYNLNNIQIVCLNSFLTCLNSILNQINPEKLTIVDSLVEDFDLVLWRKSTNGISKLVFDTFGQITYMFNGNNGSKKKGVFNSDVDMEKLLYRFISK